MPGLGDETGATIRGHNLLAKTRACDFVFLDPRLRKTVQGVLGAEGQVNITTLFDLKPGAKKQARSLRWRCSALRLGPTSRVAARYTRIMRWAMHQYRLAGRPHRALAPVVGPAAGIALVGSALPRRLLAPHSRGPHGVNGRCSL